MRGGENDGGWGAGGGEGEIEILLLGDYTGIPWKITSFHNSPSSTSERKGKGSWHAERTMLGLRA